MGMSSTVGNVGSLLNSGLTLQNNQQGNQQGPGDLTGQIGMPYGPGYMQPNQNGQPTPSNQINFGGQNYSNINSQGQSFAGTDASGNAIYRSPLGLEFSGLYQPPETFGYFDTSGKRLGGLDSNVVANQYNPNPSTGGGMSFGKSGPAPMPDQGAQPVFNLPNPVTTPGPGDLTGQIGMPAGPGYMQPQASRRGDFFNSPEYKNFNGNGISVDSMDIYTSPYFGRTGGSVRGGQLDRAYEAYLQRTGQKAGYGINKDYNMFDDLLGLNPTPLPTPTPNLGQPQIGMPAGPGYMQPGQGANQQNNQLTRYVLGLAPGQDKQALMNDFSKQNIQLENERSVQPGMVQYYLNQDQYNQFSKDPRFSFIERPAEDIGLFPITPNLGQPQIGMPAGPGYMQPTPLPSPTVKAQPTPLPPATGPNLGQPQIGMPAGPGYMQPRAQPTPLPKPAPAPVTKPIVRPAPIPQTRQQVVQQVGIRQNQKAPTKVQPSLSTRPTGRIGRR